MGDVLNGFIGELYTRGFWCGFFGAGAICLFAMLVITRWFCD